MKPGFFIVGAPRCGTTAMAQFLSSHPEVFMAQKEMHGFGRDLRFGRRFYRRDFETYLTEFDRASGQKHAGEASVWYLLSNQAASEIKAFNPASRIIIMLREPSEMLFSLYHEFRWDGNEHLPTFEAALAAEPARRAGLLVTRRTYFCQGLVYREVARLTEQVRRYFDHFGRERVHIILYDDFAADPASTYRDVLSFLEIGPDNRGTDFKVINGCKSVKSPLLQALIGDQWIRAMAIALSRHLPRLAFSALRNAEEKIWRLNTRPNKRSVLAPDLREKLLEEFRPEVESLSRLIGRDLSDWSEPTREFEAPGPAVPERADPPVNLDVPALQTSQPETESRGLCPTT